MELNYCYLFLLVNFSLASAKFIHPEAHEDIDEHAQQSFRTFAISEHEHDDHSEYQPLPEVDVAKDGLWMLSTKIEQLKMFEKALKEKIEADKKKHEALLHEKLEKLLHPKKINHLKKPVKVVSTWEADSEGEHELHYQAPPPPPAHAQYDPYHGH